MPRHPETILRRHRLAFCVADRPNPTRPGARQSTTCSLPPGVATTARAALVRSRARYGLGRPVPTSGAGCRHRTQTAAPPALLCRSRPAVPRPPTPRPRARRSPRRGQPGSPNRSRIRTASAAVSYASAMRSRVKRRHPIASLAPAGAAHHGDLAQSATAGRSTLVASRVTASRRTSVGLRSRDGAGEQRVGAVTGLVHGAAPKPLRVAEGGRDLAGQRDGLMHMFR
jgi:hypothetical protein